MMGVYGSARLSWLLGMKWRVSLLVVLFGATVSNGLVALSATGTAHAVA
jgi:uncharacterized membrane protein